MLDIKCKYASSCSFILFEWYLFSIITNESPIIKAKSHLNSEIWSNMISCIFESTESISIFKPLMKPNIMHNNELLEALTTLYYQICRLRRQENELALISLGYSINSFNGLPKSLSNKDSLTVTLYINWGGIIQLWFFSVRLLTCNSIGAIFEIFSCLLLNNILLLNIYLINILIK